jgi:pimeloyl-ACP methyl ester carboxylesterase
MKLRSLFLTLISLGHAHGELSPGWPAEAQEISVLSSADGSAQPATAYMASDDGAAKPLLVGLHSWGTDNQKAANGAVYAKWAIKQGWHFIYPNFRGPNYTPESMGSDLAVQDVVDAVQYMQKAGRVDSSRIYLIGASGGGHMALLAAGRHPEIWAGVSAWVPIVDIVAWHAENLPLDKGGYAKKIQRALGGSPDDPNYREDAEKRSPVTWLANARNVPLDINHGFQDGRKGSVPFRHSLLAFNCVADPADRLPEAEIAAFYESQKLPDGWQVPEADPGYRRDILFRKVSGNARITIFEGGHEILYAPALNWLAQQRRDRPAVWELRDSQEIESSDFESGK